MLRSLICSYKVHALQKQWDMQDILKSHTNGLKNATVVVIVTSCFWHIRKHAITYYKVIIKMYQI